MASARPFVADLWHALGGAPESLGSLEIVGRGDLPSVFRVTDLAAASIGVAGLAASVLVAKSDAAAPVSVDRAVASAWFGSAVEPVGWELPSVWDPLVGNYRTVDGWIRLHTNAPKHRCAALGVLGSEPDPIAVAAAVSGWEAIGLETAVVDAGGCAAAMRTSEQWGGHPQGSAVAAEPLLDWSGGGEGGPGGWQPTDGRPLAGLRVLDLTRVLAGPVATRFLAGLGADVLRIDPPDWDEDAHAPEMTLGKRAARLDARTGDGLRRLRALLADADVLVHGYRLGALDRLGLSRPERERLRPGLVEATLDAYGFTGPFAGRRGFDSLVQMSSGIAAAGAVRAGTDEPVQLPVQALDHSVGYLLAAAVLRALTARRATGRGSAARTSLARVARLLVDGGELPVGSGRLGRAVRGLPLDTAWGEVRMLAAPMTIAGTEFRFAEAPRPLGTDSPEWPNA